MPPKKSNPNFKASTNPAPSKLTSKASAMPAFPVNEPVSERLQSAIFNVDSAYLRTSILELCKRKYDGAMFNEKLEEWLAKRIANTKAAEEEEEEDEDEEDEDTTEGADEADEPNETDEENEADSSEEEISQLATCEYCNQQFDLLHNKSKDCRRHTGCKELDYDGDFWADHDDDCHGNPEDFIDDEDYAEGFIYSCCQKLGDAPGCKATTHKAAMIIESYRPKAGVKRKVSYETARRTKVSRVN